MDASSRIRQLMQQKGWSMYMLSKKAGLSATTLQTMFARSTAPSLATIEAVCGALDITLAQFFAEDGGGPVPLDAEQKALLERYALLSEPSRAEILRLMELLP